MGSEGVSEGCYAHANGKNGAEPFPEEGGEVMRVGMEESGLGSSETEGRSNKHTDGRAL